MIIEHRESMRVDDRLIISWRPADGADLEVDDVSELMLLTVNREINNQLAGMSEQNAEVANVLKHLNHKLDLIADLNREVTYGPSLTRVNISRSGMAFEWRNQIAVGSVIRLALTLPPSNGKTTIVATVLDCEVGADNGRAKIRCRFAANQDERIGEIASYIDYAQGLREDRNRLRAPVSADAKQVDSSASPAELLQYR